MKLYYIVNARMPTEKAHGIQIAKMCEAFIEAGVDLTLIVPKIKTVDVSIREYYGLRVDVPLVRLPVINTHTGGKILYALNSLSFAASYFVYRWLFLQTRDKKGEKAVAYTIDTDNISYGLVPFLGLPYFSETHTAKSDTFVHRLVFPKISGLITINNIIKKEMMARFNLKPEQVIVEPNGVDAANFLAETEGSEARIEARRTLGIDEKLKLVLYNGRFFGWKGLEILAPAATILDGKATIGIVGGPKEDFIRITGIKSLPANLIFFGEQPYIKMPLWLRAADAVIVLGTKRDSQSYYYTSPMKLFEYLAAGKLIIASDTPAIREIISEKEAIFYKPDDAGDMAQQVWYTLNHPAEGASKASAAKSLGESFSWRNRAIRILQTIRTTTR